MNINLNLANKEDSTNSGKFPELVRIKTLTNLIGLSRSYIYHLVKTGDFPTPVKLVPGGTSSAWVKSEVEAWVNQRISERNNEAISN